MKPNCAYCLYSGDLINHMRYCSKLGFCVVNNRVNKTMKIGKAIKEICRAEELGKGKFEVDHIKFKNHGQK